MKLRSTLFFAAASLSASALLPVAATTSAFFAASAVPAQAEDVTLTQNDYTNLGGTDQTGTGNTYTYDGGEDDKVGSWIGWTAENANTHADVAFSGTLSGDGLVGFYVRNGNGTGYMVNSIDLSGISADNFTGRLTAVNPWNNNVFVKVSGTTLSNAEFAFAGLGYEEESWKYKRGIADTGRGNDTLYVATGGATLAGVSGTSQGFASGEWQFNAHEFILAETAGAVLTLAGSGDYAFYGTVGKGYAGTSQSSSEVGLSKTGTGTQIFGGTNNLSTVSVSAGTLNLSGETTVSGTTAVSAGTLDLSGAATFSGNVSVTGDGKLDLSGTATFSGGTTEIGALNVADDATANFTGTSATVSGGAVSGALSVGAGTTFTVSGGTVDFSSATVNAANAIVVSDGASVNVSTETIFELDAMTAVDGVYTLFSGDGTVEGWNLLDSAVNFLVGGYRVSSDRAELGADAYTLTLKIYDNLVWAGEDGNDVWSAEAENWTINGAGEKIAFFREDGLTFDSTAAAKTVRVESALNAKSMTVSDDYTFTTSAGAALKVGSLSVSSGKTMTWNGAGTLTLDSTDLSGIKGTLTLGAGTSFTTVQLAAGTHDFSKITGEGAIVFNAVTGSAGYDGALRVTLADGFSGDFVLNKNIWLSFAEGHSSFADATIALSGDALFHSTQTVTLANDIRFDGNAAIWADSKNNSNPVVTLSGNISGVDGATFFRRGSGTMNLTGNVQVDGFTAENGATTFSGDTTQLGTAEIKAATTFSGKTASAEYFYVGNAAVNFGTADAEAGAEISSVTTVDTFVMGAYSGGTGTVNVNADAVLTVTGNSMDTDGSSESDTAASFVLGEWSAQQAMNVGGVLNLQNAGIAAKDGTGTLTILEGGEVNFNAGLTFADNGSNADAITVVLNSGGRMNIGAGGIAGGEVLNLTLNGGATIGSLAESWSVSRTLTLNGDVTFDTTLMEFTASGKAKETESGSNVTLDGDNCISGSGALVKTGAGTLTFRGINTSFTGEVRIEEGTIILIRDRALGDYAGSPSEQTANTAPITVKNGGTLQIALQSSGGRVHIGTNKTVSVEEGGALTLTVGGITLDGGTIDVNGTLTLAGGVIDLTSGALDLSAATVAAREGFTVAGTAVTVSADTIFVLDDMTRGEGGVYTFFTVNSGAVTGFDALNGGNFTLGGVEVGSRGDLDATNYTLTLTTYDNLVWAGGTEGTWNSSDQSWTVGEGGAQTTFFPGDSVTFNTENALVTVEGTLAPDGVTISKATTFTGEGTVSVAPDSLTIDQDVSLTLAGGVTLDFGTVDGTSPIEKTILSSAENRGRVKVVSTSSGHGTQIRLGTGFNGTLVYSGKLNTNNFTVGADAQLELSTSSAGGSIWGNGTINNDILFTSDYRVGDSDSATITLAGNVSADEGKTLTLGGTRDVASGTQVNLSGNVDADIVMQAWGTTNISGTADIATLNVSNGTVNFASSDAEIGALNFTANGANVVFSLAEGAEKTTYAITGAVTVNGGNASGGLTVKEGVTVSAASLTNSWGLGTLRVDGTLDIAGELKLATGAGTNTISGAGTIKTRQLSVGNGGTYDISVNRLEIGAGGITRGHNNDDYTVNLGATTIAAEESWSSAENVRLSLASERAEGEDGSVSGGTTFEINGADTNVTIAGVLGGSGALVKTGEGTLTLSGANTYTGGTTVSAGTLVVGGANALGTGEIILADGGTITVNDENVNAVVSGTFTATGGTVSLDAGSLTLAGTVAITTNTADGVTFTTAGGKLEFASSVSIVLDNLTEEKDGVYTFTNNAAVLGDSWAKLDVGNIYSAKGSLRGMTATFDKDDGTITISGTAGAPTTLYWKGGDGTWRTGKDQDTWQTEAGVDEDFLAFDNVEFGAGDANVTVQDDGVTAGKVTIGGNVTFTGGKVTSQGGFMINEGGTLTLTFADGLKGDVTVAGTLDVNGVAGLSDNDDRIGTVTLNGGSLVNNGDSIAAETSQLDTVVLTAGSFVGGTGNFGIIAPGNKATSLDLGGHTLTKQGTNTLHLYNTSVTAGTIAVTAGTVSMTVNAGEVNFAANVEVAQNADGSAAGAFNATVSGGTLNFSGNADVSALTVSNGTVNFSGGGDVGTLTFNGSGGNVAFNGAAGTTYTLGDVALSEPASYTRTLSVGKDVTVNATSLANRWGMGALTVDGELNFSGDLKFATGENNSTENNVIAGTGTLRVNSLTFGNLGVYNISVNRLEIGSGGIIYDDNNGNNGVPTVNLGATTIAATESWRNGYGDDAVTPRLTLVSARAEGEDGSVSGGTTFEIKGADTVAEIEAKIDGEGTLVKTGEGTLTLSGTNTYTGGTTVEEGTLQLMLGGDYTTGDVSVASGATLQLSTSGDAVDFGGTEEEPVTLTFGEGGVLSVGEGTVNLTAGTTLAFTGEATLTYRSGEEGGTLSFADSREVGAFVFYSQGTVSSASVGKSATLSAGELSFAASANRGAEMSGEGTLAVGKISVDNTRSGNKISVGTLELTQAETEISVARNGSLEISSEEIVFSDDVKNGTLVKKGAGTLTVGDAFQDDFAGSLRVDAGTVSTNLLNLSGALTLEAGTTFDGSVDASAGSSVDLGAGARIDGDLTLTDATATLGEATVTGDLTVSGSKLTFDGTVSGIGTLTWRDGNGIDLDDAFRAEISSAGNGVLLDFNVGLDGDGNALTEDFDFDFDASALADSFLGRDVDLVYNENDTSIEIVVTGALVWNETVTHWTVSGAGSSGHEHDQWDVVTRDGVSEESAFFKNGDFVQFTTEGRTRLVGIVYGGSSFAGKGTEPLGYGIVQTAGIVFDIEGGGAFTLDSKKRYNLDGELVDDGKSVLNSTAQGKDEGITVLSGNVTIGKNVVNNLVGGTKIYGGSLTVYTADALGKADELGNVSIEVGNTASATRATLTFAQEGELTFAQEGELAVDRKISISVGNANAQIGVTNADAEVSLDRVVKNAAAEEGAALTKLGEGTLNIARGDYTDAELLDRVAVNAGTLTFTGDDGGLPTRNVSVASGATLNVEHGGSEVAFDAMDVAGTVNIGTAENAMDRSFSARTISATGTDGEISGALQLDGDAFEFEIDGVATTYKGTLFYAEDADQRLAFTGTISAAAEEGAALTKLGAGTVSFASGTKDKFRLDADLVLEGGTVSFGEGVAASGELRVTGGNTRIEVSRTSGTLADGKSSFSDLTVDKDAGVTFALGNGMWTTDSVSGENIGLTLSGEIAAENGSVAFASTGGSSTLRGTVSIENAESATFGQLTVGGTGTNIVDLSVGNGVEKFSADAVTLYGASSLNFANPQEGEAEGKEEGKATATIGALQVIDNAGNAAKLDLGGGTLSLKNENNKDPVLYGDGTLRISNGTLSVSGQNYDADATPGIVLVDNAKFKFDVVGDGKNDEDVVVYSSLREITTEITTEGSRGTVIKDGAGTLVLYLDDETGQPVAGDITFDGKICLEAGETHLYATLGNAELTVDENATLRLFTTAKTADGGNAPEGVSRLAEKISGKGTIVVSGVLHANGGLEKFTGELHADGGRVVAYKAPATAGGNAAFAGSIRLSGGGTLAAAENVTIEDVKIAKVDVDGENDGENTNSFTSDEGASLTVENVFAEAGTSLRLSGTGTLKNAALAEGETATNGISISVAGAWTLAGKATDVDSVSVSGALTLGAESTINDKAKLSVSAGGTLTFEKAGTYENKISLEKAETYENNISLNGGTVAADAGAGQTVSLTNVSADAGSVFSAESGTLSVSAANLGDGASALRFDAAEEAVVQLDVGGAWTLDGAISGAGTFEKAGAGTLTLDSGSHDVANIAVSAGTLSVGADAAFSGTGTLTVAAGAKLESDDGQLSGFTLTGEGTATVSGALGGIENAEDVTLDGALSVSGNVSGSALAFKDGASLKGAGTTVSGTRLSGGTITLETLTVAGDSTFDEGVSTLKLQGQAGTSGAVDAAFSGSIEKSGDGTWTVSDYSAESDDRLEVSAGTLVWKNADFADGSTITADGTLRIEGAATETLAGTIDGRGTLELRNTKATLDIEAASGASWTLNITGTSAVTVNAALPGALRVGDAATATLDLEENATLQGQLNIASSDAKLVKKGAGTLTVETSSATTPHNIFGTLRVEEGAVSQKTAMSWMNNSVLDIGENGTFIVDLGGAAAKSNARLTGTGTLEIASTGADGYTLEGSVKAFAGTLTVADGATLNLRNGVFADGAAVTVEEGGVLAFMGREGGEISGVSGAGTLRVDMTVTPGADSSYLTGAYVYGDNADFKGSVEVKSGILSVSAEGFARLKERPLSVGGDDSAAYVDDGLSAGGVEQGAFLRLSGGGDLNGAFDGFESRVKEKGGVLLSAGSFSASSDFGSGQLYVAEKGAQLTLSDGADVDGSLFVASGAELVLGTAAASSASAAGTQTFAAEDAGTVLPDGVSGVSGDFTLNGKLTCLVTDATNLSAPLLAVAGTTTVNTAANKNAFKPEIVLDIGDFSGSLEGLTIVDSGDGIVSGAGSINQYVSVTDSAGGKWVVVKNSDGSLALSSGTQDGYGVSGNMSGVFDALYSEEEGSFFQRELSDKQGGELTRALVSLSPVSFGALIEMQSGFAALENDLLRERLEQRRYERTLASDRSTKFKPFVNILGADREGDGDGTDAANYDITHAGAIGGFDFAVSDNTIVGVSIGVDWAKADLKDGAGKHEGEGSRIGVYGMTVFENAYVGYGLSAGGMSFDTKRRYGDRTMTGDTNGNDVNATLLFGAGWTLSDAYGIDLAPYVGLDIGYVTADSFAESGSADTALDTDSIDRWSLRGKIGATLIWRATDRLRIGLDAMFAHEFGDSDIDIDAKIGGNAFSSKAYLMDENTIQIGPRIDFRIDDTWSVSAAYAFETDLDETTTHSANLGVRARF